MANVSDFRIAAARSEREAPPGKEDQFGFRVPAIARLACAIGVAGNRLSDGQGRWMHGDRGRFLARDIVLTGTSRVPGRRRTSDENLWEYLSFQATLLILRSLLQGLMYVRCNLARRVECISADAICGRVGCLVTHISSYERDGLTARVRTGA